MIEVNKLVKGDFAVVMLGGMRRIGQVVSVLGESIQLEVKTEDGLSLMIIDAIHLEKMRPVDEKQKRRFERWLKA